jgi:3-oxoacyl-[acyl-carrier-protein] synthase-1
VDARTEALAEGAPRLGTTMTELVRAAGESASAQPFGWVLPDTNGERHREKEWSFATLRLPHCIDPATTRIEPLYRAHGELGAATGALACVHAAMGYRLGYAPAPSALVALASEGDERGVFVVEAST